ncbi:class C beta-lactamase [Frigidibacter albus]|uniref:Beta-lactamase n=1 Tax=Frigidibacter albus TaxID=1465486 RepID=A0A6L8VFW6_9RHOB|nr:class C beta-lactamase [Frigidibacter albus]MZQ89258.1 class C beta-lactamase [Frigidibacter albus]NBE31164.1 class C beta-lactamase [Frigidibacter albus]GGH53239.1 beta-lactamase [Frigidibacter albus]
MKIATGLVVTLMATAAHSNGLDDASFQRLAAEAFAGVIAEHDIPGLAIGVTLEGRQYIYTHGLASREGEVPVTRDTLFELGSISKLFNVTLAALAEQEGALSLEDPVSAHVPQTAGSAFDRITLADLAANATGGLPLQVPEEIGSDAELMDYLAGWNPAGDPQATRSYSNVGIGLLGKIVGERTRGSYETAMTDHLLPRLGLRSTFVTVPQEAEDRYAFGYSKTDSPVRVTPGMLDAEAYGIKSSVSDMTRFLDAHLGNVPLDAPLSRALARTQVAQHDTAHFAQAMIWEAYSWPVDAAALEAGNSSDMALSPQPMTRREAPPEGPVYFNKTGATNGFGGYVALLPEADLGVVVLANRNYPNAARAAATVKLVTGLLAEAKD